MKQHIKYRILGGLLSALVVVFMWGGTQVSAAPDVVRLYVAPASQSVVSGNSVTVQVRLSKAANAKVDYAKADMTFSPSNLEIASVSRSGSHFNATGGPVTSFNNSKGTLTISGSGNTLPTNADVLVASVTFKAKSAGTGAMSFTNASVVGDLLGNGSVKNVLTATAGASIAVSSPPVSNPPPATTQPRPTSPAQSQTATSPPSAPNTAEVNSDSASIPVSDEQIELSTATQSTEIPADTKPTEGGSIQIWQWVLSGLITAAAIGGIAYVLIAKKREQAVVAPDSAPELSQIGADTEAVIDEVESMGLYPVSAQGSVTTQTEPVLEPISEPVEETEPTQIVDSVPVDVSAENSTPNVPGFVEGVEVEPLDPTWPTRLTSAPTLDSPAILVQSQVPVIEPVYVPQTPLTAEMQAPITAQQMVQVALPVTETPISVQEPSAAVQQQSDEFPDMFEEGEARLSAEGFDERLKPKNAA